MARRAAVLGAILTTAFAASAAVAPPPTPELIGRMVPPYPPELPDLGGSCFSAPGTGPASAICAYAFSAHGSGWERLTHVLVLKAVGHVDNQTQWRVLDVLARPAEPAGRTLIYHGCVRGDRSGAALVAWIDASTDAEWFEPVYRAWEFDFARERLREVPVEGVRCLNEGYGYDG